MIRNDEVERILTEQAEMYKRQQKELQQNPLLAFSTSELKRELRRRKKENE